jgi:hypothetical protein
VSKSKREPSEVDKRYNYGYRKGKEERLDYEALKDRYIYLKRGGEWDLLTTDARNVYLAGFEDAMKTLGVKP